MNDSSRLSVIHTLRGLAALGVAWFHFAYSNSNLNTGPFALSAKYGNLGVEVFFVISGFILPYSLWKNDYTLRNYGRFILKRIIRLDPPCFAAIAVALGVAYAATLAPQYKGGPVSVTFTQLLYA